MSGHLGDWSHADSEAEGLGRELRVSGQYSGRRLCTIARKLTRNLCLKEKDMIRTLTAFRTLTALAVLTCLGGSAESRADDLTPEAAKDHGSVPPPYGYQFGSTGSSGWDGPSGAPGADGADAEILADGSWKSLQLSGGDGGPGGHGSIGSHAYGCSQPWNPSYNLHGADGGVGGDGGNGGRGGDGGSVFVRYDDPSQLRQVQIFSRPGRGGYPGQAAHGGQGCRCAVRVWNKTHCHTDSHGHQVCNTHTYYCEDGRDGRYGYPGSPGGSGSYGRISLARGQEPIPQERPVLSIPLARIAEGPFTLTRNRWVPRSGALALFAPGSDIRDEYQEFDRQVQAQYAIEWRAPRPIEEFADRSVRLELGPDFRVRPTLPENLWLQTSEIAASGVPTLVVTNVVTEAEAQRLAFTKAQGTRDEFSVVVTDLAGVSDLVATEFRVKLGNQTLFWFHTRFEGAVPESLVVRDGNTFTLRLGQLVENAKRHLRPGRNLKLSIEAVRTFAGNRLVWRDQDRKVEVEKE
ncbi:MAG: hypothetical protein IT285_03230 [Bdellovibrionales bacterium]|nr:hypothetical protein [Bdellovibrionales bacterium]